MRCLPSSKRLLIHATNDRLLSYGLLAKALGRLELSSWNEAKQVCLYLVSGYPGKLLDGATHFL